MMGRRAGGPMNGRYAPGFVEHSWSPFLSTLSTTQPSPGTTHSNEKTAEKQHSTGAIGSIRNNEEGMARLWRGSRAMAMVTWPFESQLALSQAHSSCCCQRQHRCWWL